MQPARLNLRTRLITVFGVILLLLTLVTAVGVTNTAGAASLTVLILGLVTLGITVIAAWWTSSRIASPLSDAVAAARAIADGDLTVSIDAKGAGEIAQLMQALQDLHDYLFKVVSHVRNGTTTVVMTSSQMKRDNTALSARTESQASALEQTASSMEELTSTVRQNADHAHQAYDLVTAASDLAAKGGNVVGKVIDTMGSIKHSSHKIVDIISVIDGIAFQTNILALNAAVEAARAGEQGRGFAVVANEVRMLAQRSAAAAKEIKQLINDSVGKVDAGSHLVDEAGDTMKEIVGSVTHIADIIRNISTASQEQSAGIESINSAIMHIDQMTQKNGLLVEDVTKTATSLNEQALSLIKVVSSFNLGEREFGNEDEAVAMVKAGIAMMRHQGKDALLAEINKRLIGNGKFIDRDLYLSVYDMSTYKVVAHGSNGRYVGMNTMNVKDTDGRYFIKEMIQIAKDKGMGWTEYKWADPITDLEYTKNTYFERCGDLIITCGAYKR